jgi:hypothetical protein
MAVQISLNKVEYLSSICYNVLRDFQLSHVRPRSILISNTHSSAFVLKGEHFFETDQVILRLLQPTIESNGTPAHPVNIACTCKCNGELLGSIPPNTHHGITTIAVSCNGGEHFSPSTVQCLIYRERVPIALAPTGGSLSGGTPLGIVLLLHTCSDPPFVNGRNIENAIVTWLILIYVAIHLPVLENDHEDAFRLLVQALKLVKVNLN